MIIDGRALAQDRRAEVMKERTAFGPLSLGVIIATRDKVTESYIGIKKRAAVALDIEVVEYHLPEDATTERIVDAVTEASHHNGIILQLPIPKGTDIDRARNAIPMDKDVDVLGDAALERFGDGFFPPTPPVPAAMQYVLKRTNVEVKGKNVAIVGYGRLVGRPGATLFGHLGAASVTVLDKGDDVAAGTRVADIIVLGTGVAGILTPDMMKEGAVILDAGASELGGKVVGDADPACAEKASVFTPVPGGVGPIAVTEIFANLVRLARLAQNGVVQRARS